MKNSSKIFLLLILFGISSFKSWNVKETVFKRILKNVNSNEAANRIIGYWTTPEKDLKVRVYLEDGKFYGKLVDFKCNCKIKTAPESHKDTENPNPKCRENSWIGTKILWNLKYQGGNRWVNGSIYDLTSGGIYSSVVTLINGKIEVRGYWGFEFIGRSMTFERP